MVCYREVVNTEYARYINRVHYLCRVIRLHRRRRIASTSKCAEIEVGFHTQSFTHSTSRTSFSSLFLILLLPSHTTPLFVSLIHLASNNKESNNPSSIDTSYSPSDSIGLGQQADRQVRGLCHPKLGCRHPNHRDIALDHTLSRGSFVQHMTEPFPQKRDKGRTEYYIITKRQRKRQKMRKKNKE